MKNKNIPIRKNPEISTTKKSYLGKYKTVNFIQSQTINFLTMAVKLKI